MGKIIDADDCASNLKKCQKTLDEAETILNNSHKMYSDVLIGDIFTQHSESIKKNIDKINDITNEDIPSLLKKLTKAVNAHNDSQKDENGETVPHTHVNYSSNSSSSQQTSGDKTGNSNNTNNSGNQDNSGNTNYNGNQNNSSDTNYTGNQDNSSNTDNTINDNSNIYPTTSPVNFTEIDFNNIFSYAILYNNSDLTSTSLINYNNAYYKWEDIIKIFIENNKYTNYITDISIINKQVVCTLTNNSTVNFDNVTSFDNLIKTLNDYFKI